MHAQSQAAASPFSNGTILISPWEERHHHDPAGMIALCTVCHPMADRGKWTKDQLRSFKENAAPLGLIRSEFRWSERSVVYQLGGNYAIDCIAGLLPLIIGQCYGTRDRRKDAFCSRSISGAKRANRFYESVKTFSRCKLRVLRISALIPAVLTSSFWLGNRKPGIELQFHRLTIDKLRDKIMNDSDRSSDAAEKLFPKDLFPDVELPARRIS